MSPTMNESAGTPRIPPQPHRPRLPSPRLRGDWRHTLGISEYLQGRHRWILHVGWVLDLERTGRGNSRSGFMHLLSFSSRWGVLERAPVIQAGLINAILALKDRSTNTSRAGAQRSSKTRATNKKTKSNKSPLRPWPTGQRVSWLRKRGHRHLAEGTKANAMAQRRVWFFATFLTTAQKKVDRHYCSAPVFWITMRYVISTPVCLSASPQIQTAWSPWSSQRWERCSKPAAQCLRS